MTKPTLTVEHGYMNDCDDAADWVEMGAPTLGGTSLTVLHGDIIKMEGTPAGAGDEFTCWIDTFSAISADTYPYYVVNYKTSVANNGLGLIAAIEFNDASEEIIVGAAGVPAFSTSWKSKVGTLTTSGKNAVKMRLYVDDYPNAVDAGTYRVYVDVCLLHHDLFTFPFVSDTEEIEFSNNEVNMRVPNRVGNVTQHLGADSPIIRLSGEMDTNSGWLESGVTALGWNLMMMWLKMQSDPWQWFTSELLGTDGGCKVTVPRLKLSRVKGERLWSVMLRHYSLSSGDAVDWSNLDWLGVK